jgi:uncharacterized protein YabE (DUF348 family)
VLAFVTGRPGRLAAQAAVLAAVVGASVLYSSMNKTVTLSVDGNVSKVHGFSRTVGGLLKDQGLAIGPRDLVSPARTSSLGEGDTVVVRYARPFTVTVNGQKHTYWTTELSVDRALDTLGLRADGAELSASRSQPIDRAGLSMWMSTPKTVTLIADGKKRQLTTVAPTVSTLLGEQHLVVRPLDKLSAIPSTPLTDGSVVKLVRITRKRVTKTEAIAYDVTRKSSSSLYKGTTKVLKKGEKGSRSAVYELTLSDGKVTKRSLIDTSVESKPVAQVVQVGTKARPKAKSGSGGSSGSTGSSGGSGGNVGGSVDSLNWAALASCESGGNPNAVNHSGGYYGLYQFSLATWHAQGGKGSPTDYGSGEQTYRAKILFKKTGASSWPSCGPRLFS